MYPRTRIVSAPAPILRIWVWLGYQLLQKTSYQLIQTLNKSMGFLHLKATAYYIPTQKLNIFSYVGYYIAMLI